MFAAIYPIPLFAPKEAARWRKLEAKTLWESLPAGWVGPLAILAVLALGFDRALKWVDVRVESGKKQTRDELMPKLQELEARVTKLESNQSAACKAIVRAIGHASALSGDVATLIRTDLQAAFDALN